MRKLEQQTPCWQREQRFHWELPVNPRGRVSYTILSLSPLLTRGLFARTRTLQTCERESSVLTHSCLRGCACRPATSESSKRERESRPDQKRSADACDQSDDLTYDTAGFAGVREPKPGTKLACGILLTVRLPLCYTAGGRVDGQCRASEDIPVDPLVNRKHRGVFLYRQAERDRSPISNM